MKKFFEEFKTFITRGNVVDMAVGVIVGSAFTAIVNGLSTYILKPLINALLALLFGANSLSELFTFLKVVYVLDANGLETAEIDLANSIYIDWGAFINAVINFFLVAFVLFTIVKIFNHVRESQKKAMENFLDDFPTKEEKREMKALGLNYRDNTVLAQFRAEKAAAAAAEEEKKKAEEEEKARQERLENPTTEDLLKEIRDILKKGR